MCIPLYSAWATIQSTALTWAGTLYLGVASRRHCILAGSVLETIFHGDSAMREHVGKGLRAPSENRWGTLSYSSCRKATVVLGTYLAPPFRLRDCHRREGLFALHFGHDAGGGDVVVVALFHLPEAIFIRSEHAAGPVGALAVSRLDGDHHYRGAQVPGTDPQGRRGANFRSVGIFRRALVHACDAI